MRRFKQQWFFNQDPEVPGAGGDPAPAEPPATPPAEPITPKWPDNWRELYAGQDEKKMSHLSRYASPEAAFDGLIATKAKLSSGEYKSTAPFPVNGTDEEKNAWRQSNEIPVDGKYAFTHKVDENDQPLVDDFQKFAHENNIPTTQADALVGFLLTRANQLEQSDSELDAQLQQETEDKLRIEWGADYRRNVNAVEGLFANAPPEVADKIRSGRLSDGTPFGSDPDVMKFLASLALEINPLSTVVPQTGGNAANTVVDEISRIEKLMKAGSPEYWKDEKIQQRYRDLLDAQERNSRKSA